MNYGVIGACPAPILVVQNSVKVPRPYEEPRVVVFRERVTGSSQGVVRDTLAISSMRNARARLTPAELQARNNRLEQENKRLEKAANQATSAYAESLSTIQTLTQECQTLAERLQDSGPKAEAGISESPASSMEQYLTCPICLETLRRPHTVQCGHNFCHGCLKDLFATTVDVYRQRYPHWTPRRKLRDGTYIGSRSLPPYKCPECRNSLSQRPVFNYTIRSIAQQVARANGKYIPSEDAREAIEESWDEFFGESC